MLLKSILARQTGQCLHVKELVGARNPQVGQAQLWKLLEEFFMRFSGNVCNTTSRSPFFGSGTPQRRKRFHSAGGLVQFLLHFHVRHHLAADLAEPGQAVGD